VKSVLPIAILSCVGLWCCALLDRSGYLLGQAAELLLTRINTVPHWPHCSFDNNVPCSLSRLTLAVSAFVEGINIKWRSFGSNLQCTFFCSCFCLSASLCCPYTDREVFDTQTHVLMEKQTVYSEYWSPGGFSLAKTISLCRCTGHCIKSTKDNPHNGSMSKDS
jgi:hypothetical protein